MSKSYKPEAYIDQIAGHRLFSGISREALSGMIASSGAEVRHFAKGESIRTPDGFERSLGLILSGKASVRKQQCGASMLMSILKENDLFGAATLFSEAERFVACITAEESTWAILLSETTFTAMMRQEFQLAENYIRYLTARIRFLSERIDGFVQPGCEERTLAFLRQRAKDGVYQIEVGYSAMAEALCMSRASLYRVLDALEEKEWIVRSGKTISLREGV